MIYCDEMDSEMINAERNALDRDLHEELAFGSAIENGLFSANEAAHYIFLGECLKGFWFKNRSTGKKILDSLKPGETPTEFYKNK